MGTFYAAWADENRLWSAEVEEGFSLDEVLEVLGLLEERALGMRIHGRCMEEESTSEHG